ncbi:MAG TPA: hypothetical protein PK263_04625, partial [bacterium]|nr:hypothetical protein [bacterium]
GANKDEIVQDLATKLNVNKDDVQKVFDENREEHMKQRQADREAKLEQAVKDGVITADQKQKLIDRQKEMQAKMEKDRAEQEQWYKDNGIDRTKLRDYGLGMGPGMGGGRGKHWN